MFINILWFIGGFIVGSALYLIGGIQVLLALFFGFRMTRQLNSMYRGLFNSGVIYRKYTYTIIFWGIIIAAATYAIHRWLFGFAWYGYLTGAGFCFLLSLSKLGLNESNIQDYWESNYKYMSREMIAAMTKDSGEAQK